MRVGGCSALVRLLLLALRSLALKNYGIYLLTLWCIYVIAGMGLNLTVGYAGQMSIGHAAFLGIGAYTAAILMKMGFSFWFVLPLAALNCFLAGLVIGFPALRVQHHYLAFATLGFNILVYLFVRNEEWLTGGTFGISGIAAPGHSAFRSTAPRRLLLLHLRIHDPSRPGPVVGDSLALGPRLRRAARQPDPRREPGREHHGLHAARLRDRRRLRRRCRRLFRRAGAVHRARPVPPHHLAHDAAHGDRRRLGALLRPDARRGHRHPAAGVAALHEGLVSRDVRPGGGRADDLVARGLLSIPERLRFSK